MISELFVFLFSKASARVRPNWIRVFIDQRHLPHECELKLVPVKEGERMILPGAQSQYRLKPVDEYEAQVCTNEELLFITINQWLNTKG